MTITVPITEPTALYAGDTWTWRREDLADYPAPTWTLQYRFKSAAGGFEIAAAAAGTHHAVSVPAATTAAYVAATYAWQAWVQDVTPTKATVRTGSMVVLPDLRSGTSSAVLDTRTAARVMFDAVEAVMKKTATYEQQSMTWGDRALGRFSPVELLKLYDRLKMDVAREQAAANAAISGISPNRYYVRMGRG